MTGRSYAGFAWLCASLLFLAALALFAYVRSAHGICSAVLVVGFVLSLHLPQSWSNARARAHRAEPLPAVDPSISFPEQPRRGVR
ncbi:hypothetical protein NDK37_12505 [Xanthomonas citri pv. glycines]|uniref:hypothetical protein n=1 Tax=Xanthomonas citri TaxID=346 RepID=UPI0002F2DC91|nr:hypothetical protein [Xanthomonas citri]ARV23358.1 hypothetical protein A9D66_12300 [Xanthomonas citri pv. glycines str. 12-2]WLA18118.1 hypothetical protein NDK37_12505 [Xanthomonas citri pv. glycines]